MVPITIPGQAKLDAYLSNFAAEQMNAPSAFVSDLVAPFTGVARQSDKYPIFGAEALQDPGNIVRAAGAAAVELVESMSDTSYACVDHAASRVVALEEINAAQGVYSPFERATRVLMDRVIRLKREISLAATVLAAGTYNTSNKRTLTAPDKWSDPATNTESDPIGDVLAMSKAVALGCGFNPNRMVIGWDTFEALKVHPQILGRLVHTVGGSVKLKDLEDIFEIQISLASARKDVAGTKSFLWDDTVWIGYTSPAPSREEVSFAKTFLWTGAPDAMGGIGVERSDVYPRSRKSEMVDVHFWHSDVHVVTKDAGAIIIDTV